MGLLAGCASLPPPYSLTCAQADRPPIVLSDDGRTATTRLDVLTYNVEGLPWPVRSGRSAKLKEIGSHLEALRRSGEGPDIVVVQEAFSSAAVAAVQAAGYPALAAGPSRNRRRSLPSAGRAPGSRAWRKGEIGLRFLPSGLAVASRYPIIDSAAEPFSRRSCVGFDCLSNKGVLFARITVPGVPVPLDLFNTHMNAQRASGVSGRRHTPAHHVQAHELADVLAEYWDPQNPVIFGGDFNMRRSQPRFEVFQELHPLDLVHQYCVSEPDRCEVRTSWDGDEPWMDTQDLQLFASGARVAVRPVRVEAMFDGGPGGPVLSDHDGFRVVYELSWDPRQAPSPEACPAAGP